MAREGDLSSVQLGSPTSRVAGEGRKIRGMCENLWGLAKLKQDLMLRLGVLSDGITSPKASGKCTDQEAELWRSEPLQKRNGY